MTIGQRVRQARKARKLNQTQLADMIGVSQAAISELEVREDASSKHLIDIAGALDVNPVWLATGEGDMCGNGDSFGREISLTAVDIRTVPLISWVHAGSFKEVVTDMTVAKDFIHCSTRCSPSTYALRVEGESMMDRFRPGQVIFVDPEVAPVSGQYVIAMLEDSGRATFKQLITDGGEQYLKALNKDWPERIIKVSENCRIIGTVIGSQESFI